MTKRTPQHDWGWSTPGLQPKGEAIDFVVHEDTFGHMEVVSTSGGKRYTIHRKPGESDAQLRERIKTIIAGHPLQPDGIYSYSHGNPVTRRPNLQQVPRSTRQKVNWTIQSAAADIHTQLAGFQQPPIRIEDIEEAVRKIREQGMKPIDYEVMEKLIATQLDSSVPLKESSKAYLQKLHADKHTWRNSYMATPVPHEHDPFLQAQRALQKERIEAQYQEERYEQVQGDAHFELLPPHAHKDTGNKQEKP